MPTFFSSVRVIDGIKLNVIEEGPSDGPLLIFLHGFPEFSYGWRKQIDHFAKLGYRVLAPDQRGYNLSDKPVALEAYTLDELAKDVIGLIDAVGRKKAIVVGHDWGAAVTWWTAEKYPERIEKLCILNVPHHAVMMRTLRHNFNQLRKSWYIFFFQLPKIPESLMRAFNFRILTDGLVNTSRKGTFSSDDLEKYRAAWSQPRALSSMLNWYRAMIQRRPNTSKSGKIKPPTLVIWGTEDKFLGREMAQPSVDRCEQGKLVFIEGATHWVQHEEAERVNELIEKFIY